MNPFEILRNIREAALQDKLVIFIGAGVSKNSGLKLWQEFVRDIDKELHYSEDAENKTYSSEELLKIPQFLYDKDENHQNYNCKIINEYGKQIKESNIIVDTLLKLKPKHIITTNFDRIIESSITKSQLLDRPINGDTSRYTMIVKDSDLINAKRNRFFIKMHGDVDNLEHLVLKEEDYLQYSTSHCFIETFIKTLFINHTFLFIGYGIGDYNLKLIMSWVDRIINTQNCEVERTQHYFINPENNFVNNFEKAYMKKRNINILEYSELPIEYINMAVPDFEDVRGKNLYRCSLYLCDSKLTDFEVEQIADMLKFYENLHYVCFNDLLSYFELKGYPFYTKIDSTLFIEPYGIQKDAINTICKTIVDDSGEKEDVKRIFEEILLKCGITQISYRELPTNKIIKIKSQYTTSTSLGNYFIYNDNKSLRGFLENDEITCPLQRGYILSNFRDKECIKEYKKINEEAKINKDFFMQLLVGINLMHSGGNEFSSINLRKVLSDDYIRPYKTLVEYIDGFDEAYARTSRICENILKKYSPYNPNLSGESFQNKEFNGLRTEIYDMVKYFIYNSIDVSAAINGRHIWGNYQNLIETYVSTILRMISIYSQSKIKSSKKNGQAYEEYKLSLMDLYIIINLIDIKSLKYMLKSNKINNIMFYDERFAKEFLLTNVSNLLEEINYVIINNEDYFYLNDLSNKLKKCMLILRHCLLVTDDIKFVTEHIKKLIKIYMPLFNSKTYRVYNDMLFSSKDLLKYIIKLDIEKQQIDDILVQIISEFIIEIKKIEQNDINNPLLQTISETGILLNLCQLTSHRKIISNDDVKDVMHKCNSILYEGKYELLAAIYSFCDNEGQEIIKNEVNRTLQRLSANDIYLLVGLKVIESSLIINRLVELCEQSKGNIKVDVDGDCTKPLHVIARLHELNLFDDLEKFAHYAEYNHFFNFVCFPEKFDYYNFKVEWYSWLVLEKYSKFIVGETKQYLKPKFESKLDEISDENYKIIYYKLFFDFD